LPFPTTLLFALFDDEVVVDSSGGKSGVERFLLVVVEEDEMGAEEVEGFLDFDVGFFE